MTKAVHDVRQRRPLPPLDFANTPVRGRRDQELTGRELVAERLVDEVQWLRDCASLAAWRREMAEYPPVVNLGPDADHPDRRNIVP